MSEDPSEPAAEPPRGRPTQLLQELLDGTLDPGYRAAAERRVGRGGVGQPEHARRRSWWEQPAVAIGCLIAGFLLVVGYVHTHRGAPDAQQAHDRLVGKVRAGEHSDAALGRELAAAQHRLAAAQAHALPSSAALARRLDDEEQAGGSIAAHGPGLRVTLREPPQPASTDAVGREGSTPIDATHILTDRDIRSVVNELWHDGAEAIAVNGVRLTPTTAIRFAGEAVLVDLTPVNAPYTVDAIGDPDRLATRFASSSVAARYQTLVSADGIGFAFSDESELRLPAGTPASPRYASSGSR